jgi:hypothetical protein
MLDTIYNSTSTSLPSFRIVIRFICRILFPGLPAFLGARRKRLSRSAPGYISTGISFSEGPTFIANSSFISDERFRDLLCNPPAYLWRKIFAMFTSLIRLCPRRALSSRGQVIPLLPVESTELCDPFSFNIRIIAKRDNFDLKVTPAIFADCITEVGLNSASCIKSMLRQARRQRHLGLPDILLSVFHVRQQIDHHYSIRAEVAQ